MDGALRTCHNHNVVKHTIARSAVDVGFRVEVGVYGVFTRALREADRCRMDAYSVREKQELVPDLQIKGICVDSSRTNYNGGVRSTSFSTGVAKKELGIVNLMVEKEGSEAGPRQFWRGRGSGAVAEWQRRLEEIGGIKPLAFGQFGVTLGEMGPGLEALLASTAKRGADEMADRYYHLIENCEAAVGATLGVQMSHMRQRWGAAVWRAQTQVLLGQLKCALPGWEAAESRCAADTHGGGGQLEIFHYRPSSAAQLPKAKHFLVQLAHLAGPGAHSRPATAQTWLGRPPPPPIHPCAPPCAAARSGRSPGWAAGLGLRPARSPKKSSAGR
jgi:hypothetical protein